MARGRMPGPALPVHRRTRWGAALLSLLLVVGSSGCALRDRKFDRTSVTLAAEYAYPQPADHAAHQVGGRAIVTFLADRGLVARLGAGAFHEQLEQKLPPEDEHHQRVYWVTRDQFTALSMSGSFGVEWTHFGFEIGATWLHYDTGDGLVFPIVHLRSGRLGDIWGEWGLGPGDAPFDGRALFGGAAMQTDLLSWRLGLAWSLRAAIWREPSDECESAHPTYDIPGQLLEGFGIYGGVDVPVAEAIELNFGITIAIRPSARLGVTFHLDSVPETAGEER